MVSHRNSSPKIQTTPSSAFGFTSPSQISPSAPVEVWSLPQLLGPLLHGVLPAQRAALGPAELETPAPGLAAHTDPEFQGAVRSHKKEQSTSKLRNNQSPEQGACCKSLQSRPTSVPERSPNRSYFPKRKHPTVKTHIEVINRRPQQKRSVNEGSVDGEKEGEKKRLSGFSFSGVSANRHQSPRIHWL